MSWYEWLTVAALMICTLSLGFHFVRLVILGKPRDLARPAGSEKKGIRYSFTTGMSPAKKESAYLHLPTYAAGLVYHLGTFLSFGLLAASLFNVNPTGFLAGLFCGFLLISFSSGLFILIKRLWMRKMRILSNPDDYLSNLLVTLLQASTALSMFPGAEFVVIRFIIASVLLLYLPLGKLKHVVYFFAARYQLGIFFGRRGVWK